MYIRHQPRPSEHRPDAVVYACDMGANLWGESPLYMKPVLSFYDGNESYIQRQGHHRDVKSLIG